MNSYSFYDLRKMENKNIIDIAPLVKVILHRYFFGDPYELLVIIDYLRDQCELTDIVYNHVARSFTMKFNKNTIKKIQKKYNTNDLDVNTLYKIIESPFHDFFMEIKENFIQKIQTIPEINHELNQEKDVLEAFEYFLNFPEAIKYLVQIVSLIERDNYIIVYV